MTQTIVYRTIFPSNDL